MMDDDGNGKSFEGWAIVELFGHAKIAGLCTEQVIAGINMLRVDVPATDRLQAFTRFFGGSAIFSITPTDKKMTMIALKYIDTRPVEQWFDVDADSDAVPF